MRFAMSAVFHGCCTVVHLNQRHSSLTSTNCMTTYVITARDFKRVTIKQAEV